MKRALVLGGGGAKGAWQAGAEFYFSNQLQVKWDVISGVSVGALNGAMLATQDSVKLQSMWFSMTEKEIYRKIPWWKNAWKLARRRMYSLWDNEPLLETIRREIDFILLHTPFSFGVTDLESGKYISISNDSVPTDQLHQFLLASSTMPGVWRPVSVGNYSALVDGGVRTGNPLGDVLWSDPDVVVVIVCSPLDHVEPTPAPKDIIEIGKRTLGLMLNEIFFDDIHQFLRVNRLVGQAEKNGHHLYKRNGKPYKHYECIIVEPSPGIDIGTALDFDKLEWKWNQGFLAAENAVNRSEINFG